MKVGFTTLGMPHWPAAEFATRASQIGYEGVFLRCTPPGNVSPARGDQVSVETSDAELDEIKGFYDEAGIELPSLLCFNSKRGRMDVDSDKIDWSWVESDLFAHVRIALRLGCSSIRFQIERADEKPRPDLKWDWDDYLDRVGRASLAAIKDTNLTAVYQNHVSSATAGQLIQMVERIGAGRLGIVLSPDHSIVMQEDPVRLAEDHWEVIDHVSWADRRVVHQGLGDFDGRYYYVRYETCENGEGMVPAASLFDTLERHGWDKYIYLKWEKSERYGPQLPEGEVALETFVKFMNSHGIGRAVQGTR